MKTYTTAERVKDYFVFIIGAIVLLFEMLFFKTDSVRVITCWGDPPHHGWITRARAERIVYDGSGGCQFDGVDTHVHYTCYKCCNSEFEYNPP